MKKGKKDKKNKIKEDSKLKEREGSKEGLLGSKEENKTNQLMTQEFMMFEIENKLRESLKTIIDPIVHHQGKVSLLIKNINSAITNLKSNIEENNHQIKDLKAEIKQQQSFNKHMKVSNVQRTSDIDKIKQGITTQNERLSSITNSLKRVKENQDGYDSRFLDTHASIESIRNVTLEDITNFKTYINKDFNKISENFGLMKDQMKKTELKLKSVNSNFDKYDQNISKLEYQLNNLKKSYQGFKSKYDKQMKKKSEENIVQEIQDEFVQLKSYMSFS